MSVIVNELYDWLDSQVEDDEIVIEGDELVNLDNGDSIVIGTKEE
jgi:hypothetical protein